MKRVRKYLQLSGFERRMLRRAVWMLPLISWALHLLGFERCRAILIRQASARHRKISGTVDQNVARARAAARMVGIAAGLGYCRARCLQRSLALWWMMQKEGICTDVFLGVCTGPFGVGAHAWVELAGVVLNDSDDVRKPYLAFRSAFSAAGLQMDHVQ